MKSCKPCDLVRALFCRKGDSWVLKFPQSQVNATCLVSTVTGSCTVYVIRFVSFTRVREQKSVLLF